MRKEAIVAVGLVLAAAQHGHAQQRSAVGDLLGNLFGTAPNRSPPQAVLVPEFRQGLMNSFGQRNVSPQDMSTAIGMLAQSLATGQPFYSSSPQGVRTSTTVGAMAGNGCRNAIVKVQQASSAVMTDITACWTGQGWAPQQGSTTGQLQAPAIAQAPALRPVTPQAPQAQPGRGMVTVSDQVDELRTMRVRVPLREMPDQTSRSLGNLIENSRVSMTGHVAGIPGWVRISTNGKVGYTLETYLNPPDQQQAAQQPPAAPARPFAPTPPVAEATPPQPWPVQQQASPVTVPTPVQQVQRAVPPPVPAPVTMAVPAPVQAVPEPVQQLATPEAVPAPVQAPAQALVAVEAPRAPVVAQATQEVPRATQAAPAAPAAVSPPASLTPPVPPPRRRVDSAL